MYVNIQYFGGNFALAEFNLFVRNAYLINLRVLRQHSTNIIVKKYISNIKIKNQVIEHNDVRKSNVFIITKYTYMSTPLIAYSRLYYV